MHAFAFFTLKTPSGPSRGKHLSGFNRKLRRCSNTLRRDLLTKGHQFNRVIVSYLRSLLSRDACDATILNGKICQSQLYARVEFLIGNVIESMLEREKLAAV